VGVIGLGDRGRHLLGALLRVAARWEEADVRVVSLADLHPGHLRRGVAMAEAETSDRGVGPSWRPVSLRDYRAMLDDEAVDAVVIATPVDEHARQSLDALHAGRHVYCEKPLATDARDSAQVLSAAREAEKLGVVFQVGLQRRYSPRYVEAIRFLQEGEGGRVLCVRSQWHTTGGPRRGKRWLAQPQRSGGRLLEQACHQLDVFNWLFDAPPRRVVGMGGGAAATDPCGLILEYPSPGGQGWVHVYFTLVDAAVADRRFSGTHELVFAEDVGVDLSRGTVHRRGGGTLELGKRRVDATEAAIEGFLRAILEGGRPRASVDVGHQATLAGVLCQRAVSADRNVFWEEVSEDVATA
jgi:predicted dehydrogenase